jgi:hypothetical protein
MDTETITKLIPPTITLIVTSLFGVLVGVLIEKFKNRFRTLEYSIRSQKIIPPLSQNLGGQLSIKLNDRVANTLKVTTVEIENKNSIDLENIVVRFTLSHNSWFQGNEAFLAKNFNGLFWTPTYSDKFNEVVKDYNSCETDPSNNQKIVTNELQPRIDYVLSNRDYLIPVFNRKEKAVFNFLIEDPIDGTNGYIFPSIIHKSVNFIQKSDDEKRKQKDLWIGIAIGIVFVSILIAILAFNYPEQKSLIIWSALIGFSYSIVGYLILYGFRKIRLFFK